jgi:hypothetical protein
MNRHLTLLLLLAFALVSCEGFFGKKTETDFIEIPDYSDRIIAYVPIEPVLDQFVYPSDVCAGFDELIYVVDQGTEEIISMDYSGRDLARMSVPGVTSVSQDRSLDLLAIGTKDTVVAGTDYTLTCIYRIHQQNNLGLYGLQYGSITNEIVHPFYFKTGFSTKDADVKFQKIAPLFSNEYYVSRTGLSNASGQFGGPDNAILLFGENDNFVTPISVTTSGGTFNDFFRDPTGLASLAQPPQISVSNSRNFIYTSMDRSEDNQFRARVIAFQETDFGVSYVPAPPPTEDPTIADSYITDPNKFFQPTSVTLTGDGTNLIFVVDAEKDSLYQFTFTGIEGIQPPPAAADPKYINVSFGGTGSGVREFNNPMGVAYADKIVYVADAGNGRILRYQLTRDFD